MSDSDEESLKNEDEVTAKKSEEKQKTNSSDSENEKSENPDEDDKPPAKKKKTEDDSDSNTNEKKRKKTAVKTKKARAKKQGMHSQLYKLSPALSALLDETELLSRSEIVKRVWKIIKERDLTDPNNRQFAICDKPLYDVIGTKRFFTFGMMKYLRNHMIKQ